MHIDANGDMYWVCRGVAQVVRRLTDTRLMSRGQELRQRISNPTPYD